MLESLAKLSNFFVSSYITINYIKRVAWMKSKMSFNSNFKRLQDVVFHSIKDLQ